MRRNTRAQPTLTALCERSFAFFAFFSFFSFFSFFLSFFCGARRTSSL